MTKRATRGAIDTMVRRIVSQFHPEQVILFGSDARGDVGPDSDVDLLGVMPIAGQKRARQAEIHVALHNIPVPKDIIVTTPQEFAWRRDVVGTMEEQTAREGKVLYARP